MNRLPIKNLSFAPQVFTALTALASLYIVFTTIYFVVCYNYPSFYWDELDNLESYFRDFKNGNHIDWVFRFHNEHRIAFPQLLFLLDWHVFHSSNLFLKLTNIAYMSIIASVFFLNCRNKIDSNSPFLFSALFISIGIVFSLCQLENFEWGFQIQFVGVYAFSILSILSVASNENNWLGVFLSVVFGIISTFTMSSGIVVWFVLMFCVIHNGYQLKKIMTLLVVALTAVLLYVALPSVSKPNAKNAVDIALIAKNIFPFIFTMLGGAFVKHNIVLAQVSGACVFIYASCIFFPLFNVKRTKKSSSLTFFAFFVFLTIFAIAIGRSQYGWIQATSGRYNTPSMLLQACLILISASILIKSNHTWMRWFSFFYFLIQTSIFLSLVFSQNDYIEELKGNYLRKSIALNAIKNDAYDPVFLREIHPHFEERNYLIRRLKTHPDFKRTHVAESFSATKWIEKQERLKTPIYLIKTPSLSGSREHYICYGYINKKIKIGTKVFFGNSKKQILGSAFLVDSLPEYDVFKSTNYQGSEGQFFYGHISTENTLEGMLILDEANDNLSVIAESSISKIVDSPFAISRALSFRDLNNSSSEIVGFDEAWITFEKSTLNDRKRNELIYHHTNSREPDTKGSLTLKTSKKSNSNRKIIIPYITGHLDPKSTIVLYDSENNELIKKISLFSTNGEWAMLKFNIPDSVSCCRVVVNDEGGNVDEWVGISTPSFI